MIIVERKQVWMQDVAIAGEARIDDKESEKIANCKDLLIEIEQFLQ